MSGICAIIRRDAAPVSDAIFQRMVSLMAYRGDHGGDWRGAGAALAVCEHSHLSGRVLAERPEATESGLVYAFSGRLDNRRELQAALGLSAAVLSEYSDQALSRLAYEKWQDDCARHLIGEVAFIVWSPRDRWLTVFRDVKAASSIHYFVSDRIVIVASDLRQVLAHPAVPRDPDFGCMGDLLCGKYVNLGSTLIKGVQRLPAAHRLTIDGRGVRLERYWYPRPTLSALRGRDEIDAAFRDLLSRVVEDHCEDLVEPVVLLSGGVDSSCILGTVRAAGDGPIHSYGLEFPGWPADESRYVDDAVRQNQADHHAIRYTGEEGWSYVREIEEMLDLPQWPNTSMFAPVLSAMRADGHGICLTGHGGDEWCTISRYAAADEFMAGSPLAAWRLAGCGDYDDSLAGRAKGFWPYGAKPALRRWLPDILGDKWSKRPRPAVQLPDFLRRSWAEDIGLADRWIQPESPVEYETIAKRVRYFQYHNSLHSCEIGNRFIESLGVRMAAPLWDPRLIDFCFSVPESVHYENGVDKLLLRRGCADRLPASIRQRYDKSEFSITFHAALERSDLRSYAHDMELHRLGIVDERLIQSQVEAMLRDGAKGECMEHLNIFSIWQVLGLECWWRTLYL